MTFFGRAKYRSLLTRVMKGFSKAQEKGSPLNYFCMFCNASNNSTVNILVLGIARKTERNGGE